MRATSGTSPAAITAAARERLEQLAGAFAGAPSEQREALHDGLEFERWFIESCTCAWPAEPRHRRR